MYICFFIAVYWLVGMLALAATSIENGGGNRQYKNLDS
jgi:hypothetical protein